MRQFHAGMLAVLLGAVFLTGCDTGKDQPSASSAQPGSEIVSAVESSTFDQSTSEIVHDGIVEAFLADFTAPLDGYAPEMELDGVLYYPQGQKLILLDRERLDGTTKHLGVVQLTDSEWNYRLAAVFADSRDGRLLAAPRVVDMEAFDYSRDGEIWTPELAGAGWVDDNCAYIATVVGIALFDSGTGQQLAASEDPSAIYSRTSGHAKSYLQPVNVTYPVDGRVYYTGFRDPELLNTNGMLYELGPDGERVVSDDAYSVVCAGTRAVVFHRVAPGRDEQTPDAMSLYYYDTRADEIVEIFTDVYYILDGEYWIVGGQVLGNHWSDKQWEVAHPVQVEEGTLLRFYVSRIADGVVDEYAFDFGTRTLVYVGEAATAPK